MHSVYAVILRLKSQGEATISLTQGHHAHALFLSLLAQASPGIADQLHEPTPVKPFTVSTLQGKFQRSGRSLRVAEGSDYTVRLTFLAEDLFSHFMDAVLKASNRLLRLESATFQIDRLLLSRQDSALCHHQSYEELLSESPADRKIALQFLSPTAFRSGGKRNVLFPDSSLVFGSYLSKWQHYSPRTMDEAISKCWGSIIVARYRLNTRILHFDSYQETGFEGSCHYELPTGLHEDAVRAINALADFAFYCGTGAKTTMGMGQTMRVRR